MLDGLDREESRRRYQRLIGEVFRRAGSPLAVALALQAAGYPRRAERTMRGWVNLEHLPDPVELMVIASHFKVSVDEYVYGEAPEPSFVDRVEHRLDQLEARLHGWEIEWASAAGQEPPESFEKGGPVSLTERAFRRRVETLEAEVRALRSEQQA